MDEQIYCPNTSHLVFAEKDTGNWAEWPWGKMSPELALLFVLGLLNEK